ncbi:MAG TPA: hypothetical protein VK922_18115 [Gemmatimonadaceae bacterium]|nr:hypothetical protein [Gemmatimonadaceae bacterium]
MSESRHCPTGTVFLNEISFVFFCAAGAGSSANGRVRSSTSARLASIAALNVVPSGRVRARNASTIGLAASGDPVSAMTFSMYSTSTGASRKSSSIIL